MCPACGHENRTGAKFCARCRARLPRACAACGTAASPDDRFCTECGADLPGAEAMHDRAPSAPAAPAPAPRLYTPAHLAERILAARADLQGERKQVTVLFADVTGSTALIQGLDPEEADALLKPAVQAMIDAVHRYEGTVNRVQGDGVMALFGAPLAHEDHAVRACYAALAMQESARRYADEARRIHGVELQVRVGLNSGEVVIREIGSDLHVEYDAVGPTTHLAARMEQLATPGTTRLSPATLALAEGYVQVRSLGPVPVKGLPEPLEVFELLGAGQSRTRMQVSAARGLTRFVGRLAELETLRRAQAQAGEGHGQLVAVVGEPGVGKSRLFWEFTHSHRTADWLVLESSSVSYGQATGYMPVIDLLKSYLGIEARDDIQRVREKLLGKVLGLDEALRRDLPPLLALLDAPVNDPTWQAAEPPQRRRRILDAVRRLLLRESQRQPIVVVFEDLHWVDEETQALLDSLVEGLPTARLLLLVNYRPEYRHTWSNKTYYAQIRIDPLPPESAGELLDALLGTDPGLVPVRALLLQRTAGNPFFLEESVRQLVETGALGGERGSYRLARPVADVRVPATVQAILAGRIDRLPPEDKRLLQAAAVVGKDVPYPLLRAIADLSEDALQAGLARLQAGEFLYEASLFPDLEYTFKHALTHEVAYGSLLADRRRTLHARIVGAIESAAGDRVDEHVERLAHHAHRGELWEKALTYCRQAGNRAVTRFASREAAAYLEQAIEALAHLPPSRRGDEIAVDLRLEQRTALRALGEQARLFERLTEALAIVERLDDPHRLGQVCTLLGVAHAEHRGDSTAALVQLERAQRVFASLGDRGREAVTRMYMATNVAALGRIDLGVELAREAAAILDGDLGKERLGQFFLPAQLTRAILANLLADHGFLDEAIQHLDDGLRIAREAGHRASVAFATAEIGRLLLMRGDVSGALPRLEQADAAFVDLDLPGYRTPTASLLALAYASVGRPDEALAILEAIGGVRPGWLAGMGARAAIAQAEAFLRLGREPEARSIVTNALATFRKSGRRFNQALTLRVLGDCHATSASPDVVVAESCYREALAIANEMGMRPLAAHCRLALGRLRSRLDQTEAVAELTAAREAFRGMNLPSFAAEAEAELARLEGAPA